MVLVVVSHRRQTLIAAFMLFLGIFINTVGMDPVTYSTRYTFGQTWLSSGVNLIVVVLGLFALSQAFLLLVGRDKEVSTPNLEGGLLKGMLETLRFPKILLPSSIFGVLMGIIPGVGEFLAQFFSYTWAQKISKEPHMFGKGSPEGLIASEAANNAVPPAAMIPLLALGIPGEALTAMMLSVFYVHNVVPGPALFRDQPDFILALFLCMLILNVMVVVFLLISTRSIIKVMKIPNRFLGIVILCLSFVGVYSMRNSAVDCLIASVFGLFGLIIKRLDMPVVPIILGIVLGGIAQAKFRTSMARVDTPIEFINRPIAAILFALILIVIISHCYSIFKDWQAQRQGD